MKVKSLEGSSSILLIFLMTFLILHTGAYIYTSTGTAYFELWLLLQTIGITLIIMSSISNILPLPSNFYKTDGNSYLFYNNRMDIIIKLSSFIIGTIFLVFGIYLQPQDAIISNWRTNSWFSYVLGTLMGIGYVFYFVKSVTAWFKNKNDKLLIDKKRVHCFDTELGEKIINLDTVQEIEFLDEIIKFKGEKEDKIDLSQMSLQVYSDKIQKELTTLRKDIKISKIK